MPRQPGEIGDNAWNMTGEIANKYVLIPVFLLCLWAGKNNLSPRQVLENKKLIRLTNYCLRFHCGAQNSQITQTRFHGALQAKYNFQYSGRNTISVEFGGLISTTVMCVHMWTAALSTALFNNFMTSTDFF